MYYIFIWNLIENLNTSQSNTIIEEGGLEALEAGMDALEEEVAPSLEVVEVPSLAEEASRTREALLLGVEGASRALEVSRPWREEAWGGSQEVQEGGEGGA